MYSLGLGKTDIGKQRKRNEDSLHLDNELGLYVISDGMGGHQAGDVASAAAVEVAARVVDEDKALVHRVASGRTQPDELLDLAREAVETACREVFQLSQSRPEYRGMGGTLTLLVVAGSKAVVAHVGDTRLYLVRGGEAHQLTTDHTLAAELVKGGVFTAEEAQHSRHNSVLTRALGIQQSVQVDTLLLDVLPEDRFLLCSDGMSHYIAGLPWLAQALAVDSDAGFDDLPDTLVDHANEAGGDDNIAVIVVRVKASRAERPMAVALTAEVEVKLDALSSVFLFEDLTLAQLSRILNACEVRRFGAGEVVQVEGERCHRMVVVLEGSLKVSRGDDAAAELQPGDALGEATLLHPRRVRATVRAAEPCRALLLERRAFMDLARERPWLGVDLLQRLGQRVARDLFRVQAGNDSRSAEQRAAGLL